MRVGIGHDTHRLQAGGPLRLGGVEIPHDYHLVGHSDADVLLHAVTDAVLGAAALGDIGELFPDTDPLNRDRDSAEILSEAVRRLQQAGYKVSNVDCIVFAERPKLSSYKQTMQQRIAEILQVEPDCVGMKAKSGEGIGDIGREEGMAAQCVALVIQTN
ncbi:MAG: 2-C-methyl-D-erythritol 2,4-cyclodiphosphate synthase [Pirellulales bacterium]|nr:2-C-methyl-D-erythritol 2,4-cyclodiphosphate synthase [Pirellulales bacterium]